MAGQPSKFDAFLERRAQAAGRIVHSFADGAGKRAIPLREQSAVSDTSPGFFTDGAPNPCELIEKHGFDTLREMRHDDTIRPIEKSLFATAFGTGGEVKPADDDPEDARGHAAGITYDIAHMAGSFKSSLCEIGSAWWGGFSVTEFGREAVKLEGKPRWTIERLATREPDAWSFDVDIHGRLAPKGFVQTVDGVAKGYDPWYFIHYAWDKEFDNWYGTSALRAAYRSWWYKKHILRFWAMGLERYAGGVLKGKLPANATKEQADRLEAMMKAIQNDSKFLLPEGYDIELLEMQGGGLAAFEKAIKLLNMMTAASLLAPEHIGYVPVDGGSYAKAEAQISGPWAAVVEDLREDMAEDVIGDQLIRRQVEVNHGAEFDLPRWEWNPLCEDDYLQLSTKITEAVRGGTIKHWSFEDEDEVRGFLKLPALPEDVKREETQPTRSLPPEPDAEDEPTEGEVGDAEPQEAEAPKKADMAEFPAHCFADAWKPRRKLTPHEAKCDFAETVDRSRKLEVATVDAISDIARKWREDMLAATDRVFAAPEPKRRGMVKSLDLRYVGDYRRTLHSAMVMSMLGGEYDVRGEYERGTGEKYIGAKVKKLADGGGIFLIPREARKYFAGLPIFTKELALLADQAFFVAGVEKERILAKIHQILYSAMEKGDHRWARSEVRALFDQYLVTGEYKSPGATRTRPAISPAWHAETVVRTNLARAHSMGRKALLEDPEVAPAIEAYQWTSILDENTTDHCESADGKVFDKDEVEWPPAHMNCRSDLIPIFRFETGYEKTSYSKFKDQRGKGF